MQLIGELKEIVFDNLGRAIASFIIDNKNILNDIPKGKLSIKVDKKKKQRSLDANAYCWELIGKLAEATNGNRINIYKKYIYNLGVGEIVPIKNKAVETWIKNWGKGQIGWVCDNLGECRTRKGYSNIASYYGSSTFDTKQMSRLIDDIIEDCKLYNIETRPPEEIESLRKSWHN